MRFKSKIKRQQNNDGIGYNIFKIPQAFTDEEVYFDRVIANTLRKIPENVRDKIIINEVIFNRGISEDYGSADELWLRVSSEATEIRRPLITLNFTKMMNDNLTESDMMFHIAHEIAHVVLEHHKPREFNMEQWLADEREADELAKKWGFKKPKKKKDKVK